MLILWSRIMPSRQNKYAKLSQSSPSNEQENSNFSAICLNIKTPNCHRSYRIGLGHLHGGKFTRIGWAILIGSPPLSTCRLNLSSFLTGSLLHEALYSTLSQLPVLRLYSNIPES